MKRRHPTLSAVLIVAGSLAAMWLTAHVARLWRAPRRERRSERARADADVPEAPADPGIDLQDEGSGVGALTHRCYRIEVPSATFSARSLIKAIELHLRELSPAGLAAFDKSSGSTARMAVGDEYDVTMLGPWNGRVRVAEVTDSSFTLVTLDGHPEAGHITFAVTDLHTRPRLLTVTIDSWARARDDTVLVAYDTLSVGRRVQTEVWVTFLQRVAKLTGATDVPEVDIQSEELTA